MNTITLISGDKKIFKISEYQAEKFAFLTDKLNASAVSTSLIFPKTSTYNIPMASEYRSLQDSNISLMTSGSALKLLFDYADIYMNAEKEKVFSDLVEYAERVKTCLLYT